jgi:opacity protein-like surface antigen
MRVDTQTFILRLLFATALLSAFIVLGALLTACASYAADPPRRGKIAAPQQQQPVYTPRYVPPAAAEPAYKVHNFYAGAVGGYSFGTPIERTGIDPETEKPFAFVDRDDTFQAGIVAGYLWRGAVFGMGVEADYLVRNLGDPRLEDGIASVRGRAGVFASPGAFVYATAGVAEITGDKVPDGLRRGLVVGGGIDKDVTANWVVRAEVLHYRHGDDHFEWADDNSTAGRVGLLFKF